jgi:hypothetical protein
LGQILVYFLALSLNYVFAFGLLFDCIIDKKAVPKTGPLYGTSFRRTGTVTALFRCREQENNCAGSLHMPTSTKVMGRFEAALAIQIWLCCAHLVQGGGGEAEARLWPFLVLRIFGHMWRNDEPYHGMTTAYFREPGWPVFGCQECLFLVPLGAKSGPVFGARFRTENLDRNPPLSKDYYQGPENGPSFGPGIWHPKWVRFLDPFFEKIGLDM